MDRAGTKGLADTRSGRGIGLVLTLSLHAGVASAAWFGLSAPETTEPMPLAVRFVELAPAVVAPATPSPAEPARVSPAPIEPVDAPPVERPRAEPPPPEQAVEPPLVEPPKPEL